MRAAEEVDAVAGRVPQGALRLVLESRLVVRDVVLYPVLQTVARDVHEAVQRIVAGEDPVHRARLAEDEAPVRHRQLLPLPRLRLRRKTGQPQLGRLHRLLRHQAAAVLASCAPLHLANPRHVLETLEVLVRADVAQPASALGVDDVMPFERLVEVLHLRAVAQARDEW